MARTPTSERRRSPTRTLLAIAAGLLVLLTVPAVATAAPGGRHVRACSAHRVLVRIGHHRTCLRVKRPRTSMVAQQRAADRALLAARLKPRHGHHRGRTLRSWLGRARRGVSALEGALKGGAKAHAASAGGSGWKTGVDDRTPDGATGAALDVVARKGKAKLTLDTKDTVKLERCPDAGGDVPGTRTRSTSLKIEVPLAHGRKLTVTSRQSASAPFTGTTDESADLATLAVGRMKMKASAKGDLRDSDGKVLARLPATALSAKATLPPLGPDVAWPGVLTGPDTAFVASRALEDALHGGLASLDPLLRSFVVAMQADVWGTYDLARRALLGEQDKLWRGGACVRVDFYAPGNGTVPAGGHADVRATVQLQSQSKKPAHKGIAAFRLTTGVLGGGTVTPPKADTAAQADRLQSDPVTFDYTAPDSAAHATVLVSAISRQGVGTARVPLDVLPPRDTIYLKVTGVGGSYDWTYSHTDAVRGCSYSAHEHYDLSPSTSAPSGDPDGSFKGGIGEVVVPTHDSGPDTAAIDCTGTVDDSSCDHTIDDEDDYLLDINHDAGAATAQLRFQALGPYVFGCWQTAKAGGDPTVYSNPWMETTVAWSALSGTQPFTAHVQGTFTAPDSTVKRDYTVTLQPVDENGQPLR